MSLFSQIMLAGGSNKIELFPRLPGNASSPWFAQTYHKRLIEATVLTLDEAASRQVSAINKELSFTEKTKMLKSILAPRLPIFIESMPSRGLNSVSETFLRGILVTAGTLPGILEFHTFLASNKKGAKQLIMLQNTVLELDTTRAAKASSWDEIFEIEGFNPVCGVIKDNRVLKGDLSQKNIEDLGERSWEALLREFADPNKKQSTGELLLLSYANHISTVEFVSTVFWLIASRIIKHKPMGKSPWTQRRKSGAALSGSVESSEVVFDLLRVKEIQASPTRSGEPSGRTCGAHEVWAHKCVSRKTGKIWTRRAHIRGSGEVKTKPRVMRGKEE